MVNDLRHYDSNELGFISSKHIIKHTFLMKTKKTLLLFALTLSVIGVIAHDGHGVVPGSQPGHYITSPVHLVPILALVVLFSIWAYRKRTGRQEN